MLDDGRERRSWPCALGSRRALSNAVLDRDVAAELPPGEEEEFDPVYPFFVEDGAGIVHARMFVPGSGIDEDPATGSAAAALAGVLADGLPDGTHGWIVHQGDDMGRPSRMALEVDVSDGVADRGASRWHGRRGHPRDPRSRCRVGRVVDRLLRFVTDMARVLVTEAIAEGGLDRLREAGHDVDVRLDLTPEQLLDEIVGAHALIIRSATKVTKEVLAAGT